MHRSTFASLLAMALAVPAGAETGDLRVRFLYDGPAPEPSPIDVTTDVAFCGQHGLRSERLIVNPENKGIKNVVLYVFTGRGGSDLPPQQPRNATHELANKDCRFEPHIVTAMVGDTLNVTNPDPVGHNANLGFIRNPAQNFTLPPGGSRQVKLDLAEPAPMPGDCNIHPWMHSRIIVLDHPFVGVSDEDGWLEIEGLPAGGELNFRIWVEAAEGAIDSVKIDGKQTTWRRNRFDVKINSGMNDLGTVAIPAAKLKAD
jgi:plastocyanin